MGLSGPGRKRSLVYESDLAVMAQTDSEAMEELTGLFWPRIEGGARMVHTKIPIPKLLEEEDLMHEGWQGLEASTKSYDPLNLQRASFRTYAGPRIWGSMMDAVRRVYHFIDPRTMHKKNSRLREIPIALSALLRDEDSRRVSSALTYEEDLSEDAIRKELFEELRRIMDDTLTHREKRTLYLRYWQGRRFEEISREGNFSVGTAVNLHSRAIEKLRGRLQRAGFSLR